MRTYVVAAVFAASALAAPVSAAVGSGTVDVRFTSFYGPYQLADDAGNVVVSGSVETNTTAFPFPPFPTGTSAPTGRPDNSVYNLGSIGFGETAGFGPPAFPVTGPPATSVKFYDGFTDPASSLANIISFAPASFTNVPTGVPVKLGTFTFQNGSWFGGGSESADNVPTILGFRITTTSASGPQFNNSRNLRLVLTVNAPFPNDVSTEAGQEAEADWITLVDSESGLALNSFRVFDLCCKPAGFGNVGTVDLMGAFGSLTILGFANPDGGFITESNLPLPPVIPGGGGGTPGVPEPASWAMLIAGFGLTGAVLRRRRALAAA